jgi:hypothetical protein
MFVLVTSISEVYSKSYFGSRTIFHRDPRSLDYDSAIAFYPGGTYS